MKSIFSFNVLYRSTIEALEAEKGRELSAKKGGG